MEFQEKLQALRKQRGLTQEELARALYVSRTAISKWESGRGYPNIESLKAIACFFSVTVDALLSSDEVLTVAEESERQSKGRLRDMVFGLLDVCATLFLFLPLFAVERAEGALAVSLWTLESVSPYLRISYAAVGIVTVLWGILTLALQGRAATWGRLRAGTSLLLGVLAVLLFTVSRQPYAAVLAFFLLAVKAILLLKRP